MTETLPFRVGPCQGDQSWNSVSVYTKIHRKMNAFIPMQRSNKLFQQTFEIRTHPEPPTLMSLSSKALSYAPPNSREPNLH
jgi:hypothetical protein